MPSKDERPATPPHPMFEFNRLVMYAAKNYVEPDEANEFEREPADAVNRVLAAMVIELSDTGLTTEADSLTIIRLIRHVCGKQLFAHLMTDLTDRDKE